MMPVQIGAKPDAGFDDPLAMLYDCHRRVERFLNILASVVRDAESETLTEAQIKSVHAALHYFRESGVKHTRDEEESLFPRILGLIAADVRQSIENLQQEHHDADQLHDRIDYLYELWIAKTTLNPQDKLELVQATESLSVLYSKHIAIEESLIFPTAKSILNSDVICAIGHEFAMRRNVL